MTRAVVRPTQCGVAVHKDLKSALEVDERPDRPCTVPAISGGSENLFDLRHCFLDIKVFMYSGFCCGTHPEALIAMYQ